MNEICLFVNCLFTFSASKYFDTEDIFWLKLENLLLPYLGKSMTVNEGKLFGKS